MGKVQEEIATRITLDAVQAVGSLSSLKNEIKATNNEWKAQETALKSAGDYLGAAKAKYAGLTDTIKIQKQTISELETRQRGLINVDEETAKTFEKYTTEIKKTREEMSNLDTSISGNKKQYDELNTKLTELKDKRREETNITQKDIDSYVKLSKQISAADKQLASYEAQQKRALSAVELQKAGILELKDATSMATKISESYVSVLEAEGKTFSAQKEKLSGLIDTHKNITAQLKAEKEYLTQLKSEYGEASNEYKKQVVRINDLTTQYKENESQVKKLNSAVGGMTTQEVKMRDAMSITASKVKSGFASVRTAAISAGIGMGILTSAMLAGAKKASTLQNTYKVTSNLLVTSGEKQAEATKKVTEMQKDGTKYSTEYGKSQQDIAEQYQVLVKRGYTSAEALGAMKTELQGSIASGDSFNDVISVSSQVIDSFGMRTSNTGKMTKNTKKTVNELAYAADTTATSFASLGKGMEYVGDSAHNAGFKLSETSAAMGELSNHGLEADKAGTGLRKVITSLAQPSAQATSALKSIGISSTNVFKDANGNFKSLSSIMETLEDHTVNLGTAQKAAVFKALFGATGMQAAQILANNNSELSTLTKKVQDAGDKGSYVATLAKKNSDTAQQSEARFKQAWSNLTIMFGSKMLPYMTDAANKMSKMFNNEDFQDGVKQAASLTAKVADGFLKIGEFAVEHLGAVKTFAEVVGTIWAVNKVAKFINSIRTVKGLFDDTILKVKGETTQVEAETRAYQELATAKTEAEDINGTGNSAKITTTEDLEKSSSSLAMTGKSMAGKIIAGAGAAFTAWDVGSSISKAVTSGKATDKYTASAKTAGTVIGGGIGATVGSIIPGVGTVAGASLGATIGDQLGSTKTAEKIAKSLESSTNKATKNIKPKISVSASLTYNEKQVDKATKSYLGSLNKDFEIKMTADPSSYAETKSKTDKLFSSMSKAVDSYYTKKEAKSKADMDLLVKSGDMTQAEETKKLNAEKTADQQAATSKKSTITKMQTDSSNYYTKVESIENGGTAKLESIAKQYGKSSEQYEKEKNKELESAHKNFMSTYSKDEYKVNSEVSTEDKKGAKEQKSIYSQLVKDKGKLSDADLKKAVQNANESYTKQTSAAKKVEKSLKSSATETYNNTMSAAKHEYKDLGTITKSQYETIKGNATKQKNAATSAATEQYKNVTAQTTKQHKKVVAEADAQKASVAKDALEQKNSVNAEMLQQEESTVKYVDKQADHVKKKTLEQKLEAVGASKSQADAIIANAKNQLDKTSKHADDQKTNVTKSSTDQKNKASSDADTQKKNVSNSASDQSKSVSQHAVNQANNSMSANQKQGEGTQSIWEKMGKFFNKIVKPFGVATIDTDGSSYNFSPATMGAYSTGGAIKTASKALVGEAGIEARYQPYSGTVDLLGTHGAEFIDVQPGDQILNAKDTQKLFAGNYGKTLPGYASGTSDIESFISKLNSGASSVWDNISSTAYDVIEKITDPLKSLEKIASSTFNVNSVSGVGSLQRGISSGMITKTTDAIADVINKLKKSFDDFGGSSGGTIPSADHAKLMTAAGIPSSWFDGMNWIVNVESGWKTNATNKSSGAYGLPQSLPGSKMASAGSDWRTNPITQLKWMYDYIKGRYGSIGKAVSFHKAKGWYANGGAVSTEGLYALAEGNKTEYVIPTDPAKQSRSQQLLKEANKAVNGANDDSALATQVANLTDTVNSMATMLKTIIELDAKQIAAIKGIGTFNQKTQLKYEAQELSKQSWTSM